VLSIRAIRPDEVLAVHDLRQRAADELTRLHGRGHWSGVGALPTLRAHAEANALFGVESAGALVATFTLSDRKIGFYHEDWFADPDAPAIYLTNMAVDLEHQRSGVGRWAVARIEDIGRERGARALRFDAYAGPAGASRFYEKCGCSCVHRGTVNEVDLEYFEKVIGA